MNKTNEYLFALSIALIIIAVLLYVLFKIDRTVYDYTWQRSGLTIEQRTYPQPTPARIPLR